MKIPQNNLLRFCSSLFILLLISLLQTSLATKSHTCSPSSCGDIRNISFPFQLKHDPKHCGYPDYELICENNVTLVYLDSQKYQVKAINYNNFTIRLVDISIINTNTCSFPNYFAYPSFLIDGYPYGTKHWKKKLSQDFQEIALPINFMSCPHRLSNSSFLTDTNDCANRDRVLDSSNSSNNRHTYVKVDHLSVSDIRDMCTIQVIAKTSWKFEDLKNVSVSEAHESLLYGFELSWLRYPCRECKYTSDCELNEDHTANCYGDYAEFVLPLISLMIVVVFLGLSIAAKIILGFTCIYVLPIFWNGDRDWDWSFRSFSLNNFAVDLLSLGMLIGVSLGARFIIGFTCLVVFLVYKFRRRHLSVFDAIERYLRSDNKLIPIRYSYSDIKKMTRGFREKLGQGGYGTVYKGKLRSGHDVAVKLLGKAGENGRDGSIMSML